MKHMPIYNKLVRDKIPNIIEAEGKKCTVSILDDVSYMKELKWKLNEELEEYHEAETDEDALEELADILELIDALTKLHGKSMIDLEAIREEKALKRGRFANKVFLVQVEDEWTWWRYIQETYIIN